MLNAYESRRRCRAVVYLLMVLLGLPPGFGTRALAATRRTSTLSRVSNLETFRNPQISSASHNRFLFSQSPSALLGRGGDSFSAHSMSTARPRITHPHECLKSPQ